MAESEDLELCCEWEPFDSYGVRFDVDRKNSRGVLWCYGVFGWDIWADHVLDAMRRAGTLDLLEVHLHTPGGDAHEAVAIANHVRLMARRRIAWIDGACASAGTIVAGECDMRVFSPLSAWMIHPPWSFMIGDGREMISEGQSLLDLENNLIARYVQVSGMPEAEVRQFVLEGKWWYGDEAQAAGWGEVREFETTDIPLELPEDIRAPEQARLNWGMTPKHATARRAGAPLPAPWSQLYKSRRPIQAVQEEIGKAESLIPAKPKQSAPEERQESPPSKSEFGVAQILHSRSKIAKMRSEQLLQSL